jgi:hypothetical protein
VDANHVVIVKKIEEEINCPMKGVLKDNQKKRSNVFNSVISLFF